MTARPFRFGVNLLAGGSRAEWQAKAKQAEDLGYDVILVPDHLGMQAPFPALVAAAEATTRPHVGTFVLNAGFYKPALLAREIASTDHLTGGRVEVGLGTGHARLEFEAAELPFPTAGQRITYLEHMVTELRRLLSDPYHRPAMAQRTVPPLMIAGQGDRLLRLAAKHADIIGLAGIRSVSDVSLSDPGQAWLADRVRFIEQAAGPRFAELELNLWILTVALAGSGRPDLSLTRRFYPGLTDEELLRLPGVLYGSEQRIAEQLHEYRETHHITYFVVTQQGMVDFAKVMSQLR